MRVFEWCAAGAMVGVSACASTAADLDDYRLLMALGGVTTFSVAFLIIGCARMTALYINGGWPVWGARVRAVGALFGAGAWAQVATTLVLLAWADLMISINIPIYIALTIGELVSAYRAGHDVVRRSF